MSTVNPSVNSFVSVTSTQGKSGFTINFANSDTFSFNAPKIYLLVQSSLNTSLKTTDSLFWLNKTVTSVELLFLFSFTDLRSFRVFLSSKFGCFLFLGIFSTLPWFRKQLTTDVIVPRDIFFIGQLLSILCILLHAEQPCCLVDDMNRSINCMTCAFVTG